jgi:hypothetical protein
MSAQLAEQGASLGSIAGAIGLRNHFTAHLALAAGVTVSINAPTLSDLSAAVAKLQPTEAVNDPMAGKSVAEVMLGNSNAPARGAAPSQATTAAPVDAPKQTAAASTPAAETAAPPSQASTAAGEAGNADAAAPQGGTSAQPASSQPSTASAETAGGEPVTFDVLKKAFLALSTKAAGREKCEAVLKPFGLAKLSAATPEQYAAVLAEIEKAGK